MVLPETVALAKNKEMPGPRTVLLEIVGIHPASTLIPPWMELLEITGTPMVSCIVISPLIVQLRILTSLSIVKVELTTAFSIMQPPPVDSFQPVLD